MPTLELSSIDIAYERSGSGKRVLFLNGSGATMATSAPLIRTFAKRFDVLAHDQRGIGRSTVDAAYEMCDVAADALALADHVGWDRFRVVGVSFGGMVAQELAVAGPARVERLTLMCTSPGGAGGSSYPLHELSALSPEESAKRRIGLLDSRFTAEWLAEHERDRLLVEAMGERTMNDKSPETMLGVRLQLDARSRHDVFQRLPRVTCPTLVAAGRYDGIAPPRNAEAIAAQVPKAELRMYEGGHAFFYQDPRALTEIVDFLDA